MFLVSFVVFNVVSWTRTGKRSFCHHLLPGVPHSVFKQSFGAIPEFPVFLNLLVGRRVFRHSRVTECKADRGTAQAVDVHVPCALPMHVDRTATWKQTTAASACWFLRRCILFGVTGTQKRVCSFITRDSGAAVFQMLPTASQREICSWMKLWRKYVNVFLLAL